ncbi:MAG: CDP-glucose 4,6-dehydratase [Sphingomonas bacterium]|nr:CDP-glucose 4,6-dehydratase [Sphingomonas bacterium]
MNRSLWHGRRVLVTGHTGFKGGWLAMWLHELGAEVTGFALPAPTTPSLFEQARIAELVTHVEGDVREFVAFEHAIQAARPELIFHLAAQPLVRASYADPVETYATNVMGTVHLLDACRRLKGLRGVVCVTSDKCYDNREWDRPYREADPMGGHDPYSSSKGAAELAIASFRRSYFADGPLIASVRAGNVIGGGDWAEDRLVPDIVRAMLAGETPVIRAPRSVRPWQHVLDALAGYLLVGEQLLKGDATAASAWNFGPSDADMRPVGSIVEELLRLWGAEGWEASSAPQPHEAALLKLDSGKARSNLDWQPRLSLGKALAKVVEWHKGVAAGIDARDISVRQLRDYQVQDNLGQVKWA